MQKQGLIQIYTGSGKGKSTSAFGLVLRALGHDWNILVTQFLKGDKSTDKTYGELNSCSRFSENITIIQSHKDMDYRVVLEHNKTEEDKLLVRQAWLDMVDAIHDGKNDSNKINKRYNMLVLDEILGTVNLGLIAQKTLFDFIKDIKSERPDLEIVMTGRIWSEPLYDKIKDIADLMSDVRCVKHYFNKHCTVCKRSFEFRSNFCPNCGSPLEVVHLREGIEW